MGQNHFPLVSVLVIFYNQERFVKDTLDSVLQQDYPALEIIAADDASTDGTAAVIKSYAAAHNAVKPLLSFQNGGITQNCNNALKAAAGRFMVLLGGDDQMLPGRISRQVQYFTDHPETAVCCTDVEVFYDDAPHRNYVYRNRNFYRLKGTARLVAQDNTPPTSAMMFDMDKCRGLYFDPRVPVVSDWLFAAESFTRGRVGYIPQIYTRYRRHSTNITASGPANSHLEDRLINTDIFISRYPQYRLACKIQRCNIFYNAAKRHYQAADFKGCRGLLRLAALEWPFSPRVVALFAAACTGKMLLAAVTRFAARRKTGATVH